LTKRIKIDTLSMERKKLTDGGVACIHQEVAANAKK
jgi:hypothetical protein